ncbi:MAG: hypothetical protein WCK02_09035 [Bacteroidota bacterium]
MKKLFILLILSSVFFYSCKKDKKEIPTNATKLEFTSLAAEDTTLAINEYTKIHAIATGDELQYKWTFSGGAIVGSGKDVEWSVCHSDIFTISCEVVDKYDNKVSKSIKIYAK